MMHRSLAALACLASLIAPAVAVVGAGDGADPMIARHLVLVVGSRSTYCTGVALGRDLVLAAAHCVLPRGDYMIIEADAAREWLFKSIATITRHPEFDIKALLGHRATADVALLKLAAPLPATVVPAPLAAARSVVAGDSLVVAGYGIAVRADGRTGGTVRGATLVDTSRPGTFEMRLDDPARSRARAAKGVCTGDSGAPVFVEQTRQFAIIGVVSWSSGPNLSDGCAGLTGVTPLARYHDWIVETARKMGSPLAP
jgi:hypothetical protein